VLAEFEAMGKPLVVVRGNNDDHPAWPLRRTLERGGRRFHLEHIAPRLAPTGAEFVLSGHTHVPSDVTTPNGVRWLNPGCIRYPRAEVRSFAWLTVTEAGAVNWELVGW
jgi:predicted phosphodiesterase